MKASVLRDHTIGLIRSHESVLEISRGDQSVDGIEGGASRALQAGGRAANSLATMGQRSAGSPVTWLLEQRHP
jgi:hypothetical protein